MWDFLEKPWTSKSAKLFAFLSLSILFISTVTFIVSTVEEYNKSEEHSTQLMRVCKERFNFEPLNLKDGNSFNAFELLKYLIDKITIAMHKILF